MKDKTTHPYLRGNYAPVKAEVRPTPCKLLVGDVPSEFVGGQYVRNGGNPFTDGDDERAAHWFDGDGMLTGVLFARDQAPLFVNRYVLTDVLLATSPVLKRPFLPSIAVFAMPFSVIGLAHLLLTMLRTVFFALLSWLPFQHSPPLRRISVANTSVWWHDGQAFAGCESGPPLRIILPGLETAHWWQGGWAKGAGPIKMLNEFTTAHPRIDPRTNELLLFHMSFAAPFLRISVIPPRSSSRPALLGAPVPGLTRPKLAHDFCATQQRTILIDLPIVLDPRNLLRGRPMLDYQGASTKTRFGIMPRWAPEEVVWYESEGCCIYHAANAWDDVETQSTSLLACRLNSATLVYSAGNMATPAHARTKHGAAEKCQLYYWQFSRASKSPAIKHEFALADIPLEFPVISDGYSQRHNRFVYGASMTSGTFDAGLGTRSAKIDCLAKLNVEQLIEKGKQMGLQEGQTVDRRTVSQILAENDGNDPIRIFALPPNHYAQEASFVPRRGGQAEDDGYLTFFVFDEAAGLDSNGNCLAHAASQLWIIDAKTMTDVVCKIRLPQRVPYGLHGHFFSEDDIASQQPVSAQDVRTWALSRQSEKGPASPTFIRQRLSSAVHALRTGIEQRLA